MSARLLVLAFVLSACGASQRETTLKDTFVAVKAASDGFEAWDKSHKEQIVASATSVADGEAMLDAYAKKRQPILDGFALVKTLLVAAVVANDDPSLTAVVGQALVLYTAIKQLEADAK